MVKDLGHSEQLRFRQIYLLPSIVCNTLFFSFFFIPRKPALQQGLEVFDKWTLRKR
jgi:hypothetical protein